MFINYGDAAQEVAAGAAAAIDGASALGLQQQQNAHFTTRMNEEAARRTAAAALRVGATIGDNEGAPPTGGGDGVGVGVGLGITGAHHRHYGDVGGISPAEAAVAALAMAAGHDGGGGRDDARRMAMGGGGYYHEEEGGGRKVCVGGGHVDGLQLADNSHNNHAAALGQCGGGDDHIHIHHDNTARGIGLVEVAHPSSRSEPSSQQTTRKRGRSQMEEMHQQQHHQRLQMEALKYALGTGTVETGGGSGARNSGAINGEGRDEGPLNAPPPPPSPPRFSDGEEERDCNRLHRETVEYALGTRASGVDSDATSTGEGRSSPHPHESPTPPKHQLSSAPRKSNVVGGSSSSSPAASRQRREEPRPATEEVLWRHDAVQRERDDAVHRLRDLREQLSRTEREISEIESRRDDLEVELDWAAERKIDALISDQGDEWSSNYRKLVAYKDEYGDCLVPRHKTSDKVKEDPSVVQLGLWVYRQRRAARLPEDDPKRLSRDKWLALDRIGFDWDPHDNQWNRSYEAMKRFSEEHGHCNVGIGGHYPKDHPMRKFWSRNWKAFKLRECGIKYDRTAKQAALSDERVEKLRAIGFFKTNDDVEWDKNLQKLLKFKDEHGHEHVMEEDDLMLARWIGKQRSQYREKMMNGDGGERAKLTDDRLRRLREAGFFLDGTNRNMNQWIRSYLKLRKYHEFHGHSDVPWIYPLDPDLARWVRAQRSLHRKRKEGGEHAVSLNDERMARLDALGFRWGPDPRDDENDDNEDRQIRRTLQTMEAERSQSARPIGSDGSRVTWEECYNVLVGYYEEHGECKVVRHNDVLRSWVVRQRKQKKRHEMGWPSDLTTERIAKLNVLPFSFDANSAGETPAVQEWNNLFIRLLRFMHERGKNFEELSKEDDEELYDWVQEQKTHYRRVFEGETSKLNPGQVRRLHQINFSGFALRKAKILKSWEESFADLMVFKIQRGSIDRLMKGYDPELYEWLQEQVRSLRYKPTCKRRKDLEWIGLKFSTTAGKGNMQEGAVTEDSRSTQHGDVTGRPMHAPPPCLPCGMPKMPLQPGVNHPYGHPGPHPQPSHPHTMMNPHRWQQYPPRGPYSHPSHQVTAQRHSPHLAGPVVAAPCTNKVREPPAGGKRGDTSHSGAGATGGAMANTGSDVTNDAKSESAGKKNTSRVECPHDHDILFGPQGERSHPGNKMFLSMVALRKKGYDDAYARSAKSAILWEIMDMIRAQKPPGRFLVHDEGDPATDSCRTSVTTEGDGTPGASYWFEIDNDDAVKKLSQALRDDASTPGASLFSLPSNTKKGWSANEDAALLSTIAARREAAGVPKVNVSSEGHVDYGSDEDWDEVAKSVPGRSAAQCLLRYMRHVRGKAKRKEVQLAVNGTKKDPFDGRKRSGSLCGAGKHQDASKSRAAAVAQSRVLNETKIHVSKSPSRIIYRPTTASPSKNSRRKSVRSAEKTKAFDLSAKSSGAEQASPERKAALPG